MKSPPTILAVSLALLLGGCAVGPDYHRPLVKLPDHFKELPGWTAAAPSDDAPKGAWWKGFHDPLLDQLEPQVAVSNQTVRADYYAYQNALALMHQARSELFPTLGVEGTATRARSQAGSSGQATQGRGVASAGSLEGNVSWAPDLWGGLRRTVEENAASAQASEATLANATLSEQTALAAAVINLRSTDADIDLLQKTVEAYQASLRVVQNQGEAGTAAPSDVIVARTQLETAQASLVNLGVARAEYEHAIATLVGKNPEELDIPHSAAMPQLPAMPVGLPSTLLQRRPDVATQERQVAAANAAVGVATAAYYPSVTLSAADGFSQSPLAGLLHIANHVWSLGADVSETLLDFGYRHAEVQAARASYEEAVANYRQSVLTAFQDVEDDLSGLRILARQAGLTDAAVRDAASGAEITFNEYQAGTVDYTTVASAQATLLGNQQTALGLQQQRLLDAVSLAGDLGGGWSGDQLHDPRKVAIGQP